MNRLQKLLTVSSSLLLCLALTACSGSSGSSTSTPTPDFTLAATPTTVSLVAGGASQQVSVTATAVNGFTGSIALTITGLPTGVTATPSTLTLTPGAAQTVTLSASSSATVGSASLTLNATSGSISHTATVAGTVAAAPPPPDFSLSVSPATLSLTAGSTGSTVSVSATALNSFTGSIAVAITGLPAGVTATPSTFSLTAGTPQNVTITAGASAARGTASLTLTGTSGSLTHTASIAATVALAPDFTIAATPASAALTVGGTGSAVSISATALNGLTGTIAVAITGLPSGVTASPSTLTLTPGTPQSVTLTAGSSATLGGNVTFTGTSGLLSHSATVAVTLVTTPPDFSLIATPSIASITAGGTGSAISLTAAATNGFTAPVSVAITGLPTGITATPATLTLLPGVAQTTTLTAVGIAAASTSTVTFTGTSGTQTHTATVALTVAAATLTVAPDVTTYHYNVSRDGLNAQETILTPVNVNTTQFGKVAFDTVDGKVDAQPLYLANVPIANTYHNVLYVASEHGSLYAFDADTNTQLWKTSVITGTDVPSDTHNCSQISPEIGITATPVIDRAHGPNGAIFVVAMSKDTNGAYHQRIHAIDITTGTELTGSPTEIAATYPGTGANTSGGNVIFDPAQYAERAALLLLNGNIYTTWTSHCDIGLYTGWVIAYDESTLKQTQVINLTPNGNRGSVWMSGDGPAADAAGNIYLLDANGIFDSTLDPNGFPASGDYGNAMIKLSTAGGKLAVADYFNTYDTVSESNQDLDLGSGGELLLPDVKDSTGVTRHLIVGVGKDKNIYLADRDNMGKFNPSSTAPDMNIYQRITGQIGGLVYSTPAFFNNTLFYGPVGDHLRAFPMTNAKLATAPSSLSPTTFAYPGTIPAISANGTQNGIVWTLENGTGAPAVLHAFDPTNLANEFYNSNQAAASRDAFGNGNKYIVPLIVNGKVYVGTPTGVAVFGLLSH